MSGENWRESFDHWVAVLRDNAVAFGAAGRANKAECVYRETMNEAERELKRLHAARVPAPANETAHDFERIVAEVLRCNTQLDPQTRAGWRGDADEIAVGVYFPRMFVETMLIAHSDVVGIAVRVLMQKAASQLETQVIDLLRKKLAPTERPTP